MEYFMGQGKVFAAVRSPNGILGAYRMLGNVSTLDLTLGAGAARYAEKGTFRQSGNKPTFNLNLESLYPENLALLLYGTSSTDAGSARTAAVKVARGTMAPLPDINLDSVTSVKVGGTTHPLNAISVDLGTGAVELPVNSPIADNSTVTVGYVCKGYTKVEAYQQIAQEISLRYDGINTMDQTPVVLDLFRTKFDPVDGLSLLGDNLSTLKVTGEIMFDNLRAVAGASGFLRIRQV
jgi:hypothetical protein